MACHFFSNSYKFYHERKNSLITSLRSVDLRQISIILDKKDGKLQLKNKIVL